MNTATTSNAKKPTKPRKTRSDKNVVRSRPRSPNCNAKKPTKPRKKPVNFLVRVSELQLQKNKSHRFNTKQILSTETVCDSDEESIPIVWRRKRKGPKNFLEQNDDFEVNEESTDHVPFESR